MRDAQNISIVKLYNRKALCQEGVTLGTNYKQRPEHFLFRPLFFCAGAISRNLAATKSLRKASQDYKLPAFFEENPKTPFWRDCE
jgi:hypothetical protein